MDDDYTEEELEELEELMTTTDFDFVGYNFILDTDYNQYWIFYTNDDILITEGTDTTIDIDYEIKTLLKEGDTISVSFDLLNESDTIQYMTGMTTDFSGTLVEQTSCSDEISDEPLDVEVSASNIGEVYIQNSFTSNVYGGQLGYSYQWDFGDGVTSSEANPTHIYSKAGNYHYNLIVTDVEGTQESYSGSIEILEADTTGTPGFEFIIAIMAIGFIFLWKRKR